jgi:DNA-binding response OmpR family regulator
MVVEPTVTGAILGDLLWAMGLRKVVTAEGTDQAKDLLERSEFDLIVCDSNIKGDRNGFELVRWLRWSTLEPNKFATIILYDGHVPRKNLELARNCGANFVIKKPTTSETFVSRIMWSLSTRQFIECGSYFGPDRRFDFAVCELNKFGRRAEDNAGLRHPALVQLERANRS